VTVIWNKILYVKTLKAHIKEKEYSEVCDFIAVHMNLEKVLTDANTKGSEI